MMFFKPRVCDTPWDFAHTSPTLSPMIYIAASFSCFGSQPQVAFLEWPSLSSIRSTPSHFTSLKHPSYLFLSCVTKYNYSPFCSPVYYLSIGSMRSQKVQLSLCIILSLKSGPCKMSDQLKLKICLFQNFRNLNKSGKF